MSHAPSATLNNRHQHIRAAMGEQALDALVVTAQPNVLYLTNFKGSAGIVVITGERLVFITDFRYVTAVDAMRGTPSECPGLELTRVDGAYDSTLAGTLASLAASRVGFEAGHVTVARHQWLEKTLGTRPALVPTHNLVERARARKDEWELGALRTGGRLLSEVARAAFALVTRGRTERDVALAIDGLLHHAGFERPAFETIVASGENAALPHARPGERRLHEGDLVVLDFGGVYDSYCVDLTRTVAVGPASQRARAVHAAVLEAHDRALAAARIGHSRFAVDEAARGSLAARGMAEAFGHGTGHGLGLEVHEEPRIVRRRADSDTTDELLEDGMVFTIEPGAYFPGWGGVRIEDDVALTSGETELLTNVTTELLEL
jgi:Xaa-Pro aminopeptidase